MLSIWLPFDGHSKNQGLLETTVTTGENVEFVDGKIGKCISGTSSDNSNVVVSAPTLQDIIAVGQKYTIALWIKKLSGNDIAIYFGQHIRLDYHTWDNGGSGYVLINEARGYIFGLSDDESYYHDWHHIAVSVDKTGENTVYHYYFDGNEIESKYRLDSGLTLDDDYIFYTNNFQFNDFRLYSDEILSPKQIKKLAQGLVLRVPLTAEGSPYADIPQSGLEVVHDISGYQHNGISTDVTFSEGAPRLPVSSTFNGDTSVILFNDLNIDMVIRNQWTICFWIYSTDEDSDSVYFAAHDTALGSFSIRKESSHFYVSYFGYVYHPGCGAPIDNEWMFLAATFDGTYISIYVNDQNCNPTSIMNGQWSGATTYGIGRRLNAGDDAFSGLMSDFRIYATALSADDILDIYNGDML